MQMKMREIQSLLYAIYASSVIQESVCGKEDGMPVQKQMSK